MFPIFEEVVLGGGDNVIEAPFAIHVRGRKSRLVIGVLSQRSSALGPVKVVLPPSHVVEPQAGSERNEIGAQSLWGSGCTFLGLPRMLCKPVAQSKGWSATPFTINTPKNFSGAMKKLFESQNQTLWYTFSYS